MTRTPDYVSDYRFILDQTAADRLRLHGTAINHRGKGVLLLGPPAAGKSQVARHMIDAGWSLVGDDQIHLIKEPSGLYMVGDQRLKGLLEVRGLGVIPVVPSGPARLVLAVHIHPSSVTESPVDGPGDGSGVSALSPSSLSLLGVSVPLIDIHTKALGLRALLTAALHRSGLKP